ncbi:GspH/FimT family pseudopilin [Pseudomonas phytophila]|uniref:Type II secretion system protein H n=1 Tax=Pseudomonas phytophila TaxID=2867264 RepID=A0ABY6FH02_9PSED|nr:GspH/FimT family pseudopilin [Pseudomonas phytophila]UXZ97181.1 GspH/FimT family pseudopilin [Pseudomonas phytophila]
MTQRSKGFTLVELLITVSLVGILAVIAIPSFNSSIQNSKADTEISDLQRALNFARLEAINRGVNVQVRPSVDGAGWNTALKVVPSSNVTGAALRVTAPMSSGAGLAVPNVNLIEFNNLGGLSAPATAVAMTYTLGTTITKTVYVCLNGRIVSSGNCDG